MSVSQYIKEEAHHLGFVACGIARVEPLAADARHLAQWLGKNMHAQMTYMARNIDKRIDPAQLVPGAKSVISVAVNYFPQYQQDPELPQIAKYAYGEDYHHVVKDMLYQLLNNIRKQYGPVQGRAFTDSAPVMEHAWAARSGLGWIGKHSLLIHPQYGSYVFLGELIIDIAIEPDQPIASRCGTCTRCMDACPAKAIVAPYVVDARRCLSYLTIEYKEDFEDTTCLHHRLFGCDICQDACPFNKRAQPTNITAFKPNLAILKKTGSEWQQIDTASFEILTDKSPIQRAGADAIRRNAKRI